MPQNHLLNPTGDQLLDAHTDITGPAAVEVVVNHSTRVIHVNVNGVCVFRACRIGFMGVEVIEKRETNNG